MQELQGLPVRPVEVVGDQQERAGGRQDGPGERLEQQPALVAVGRRRGGGEAGDGRAELGQEPGELGQLGRVEPAQVPGQGARAEPGHHRPVGQRPLGRVGAGLAGRGPALGAPGAELLDQPGLAGAGLAGDQHQPGVPALGGPPQLGQPGPLAGPPDQGRPAERPGPSRCRLGARLGAWRQQGRVGPAGGRRGGHVQLPLQGGGAGVVGPQRPGPVAAGVVQPHQEPVGRLPERVLAQEPLGVADRRGVLAPGLQQLGQPLQGLQVAPAQPLPLLQQPLVVAALEQVAPVQLDRLAQGGELLAGLPGPGRRRLEGGHVQPEGGVVPPPERPLGHLQEPVGVGQGAPQVVQQVAQVGPRLGLAGVGPEQEGQALARLGRLPVEQQVGEQRLGPGRAQRRHRGPAVAQVELA